MKLSIITINYNNAIGLKKTFDSIKNQTIHDFEYIVVDGNSSDGSRDVINEYAAYITKWVSEPDSGIYNAMNKGARMSSGDYMLFLNSGDHLYTNDVIEELFKYKFNSDIICCSLYCYSNKTDHFKIPPKNVSLYTFIGGGSMLHPSTLISRKIFNKVGGYLECYKIISDWCFFIDAMIVNNCTYELIENIVLTSFDCNGISSDIQNKRHMHEVQTKYLNALFPRIICDYIPLEDESLSNWTLWVNSCSNTVKKILIIPFKFINSFKFLRRRLSRRTILSNTIKI